MTSQLNLDTIVDKAGSGGTNVKVANTSTYVSDGGAVTQNIVQAIVKAWANFDESGTPSIRDNFNVSSLTDNGTGYFTVTLTNTMSNDDYVRIMTVILNVSLRVFIELTAEFLTAIRIARHTWYMMFLTKIHLFA